MTLYDISVKDAQGNDVKLDKYKGKVLINSQYCHRLWFHPSI